MTSFPQHGDGPKVLWLARMLPLPLRTGDRIYTARLAEALGRSGARVHFVGLANPEAPELTGSELDRSVHWEVLRDRPRAGAAALFSSRPMVAARFGTRRYAARLRALLADEAWDAVVLDHYGLAWALPLLDAVERPRRPVIVHIAHNFETAVAADIARAYSGNPLRKFALARNARLIAAAERELSARAELIVALTPEDAELLRGIGAQGKILVLPPGYDGPRTSQRTIDAASPRRIGIVGSFDWSAKQISLANFLAASDAIFAQAGIELAVAGQMPAAFRQRWDKLGATRIAGVVDDLVGFLSDCRIGLVIDAVGGGFKLKVLDYVMTRTPVAALRPALGGQSPEVTRHFLVADDEATLAREIAILIDDIDRLNAMTEAAFEAAAARYDWDANGQQLKAGIMAALA
jgi:glycosyltransferase involved in cell wall biosynthesis